MLDLKARFSGDTKFYVIAMEGSRCSGIDNGFGIFHIPMYISGLTAIFEPYSNRTATPILGSSSPKEVILLDNRVDIVNILLVEDNKINQVVASNYLKTLAFVNLEVQDNGLLGLKAYKAKRHDLILMDIFMPEMDGLTAAKQIRLFEQEQNLRKVPIIALTASHTIEIEQKNKSSWNE